MRPAYPNKAEVPLDPLDYWREIPERRAQQLYVAFSEFASSCLDYCEGCKVLREAVASDGRLNWASTILYYALVHSARLLVFLAFGDFPTNHKQLANCFEDGGGDVRTNWLDGFAHPPRGPYRASVTFTRLCDFWSIAGQPEAVTRSLARMGRVLSSARELRNENNYEALLIAHEFRHAYVTPVFRDLADTMQEAAFESLRISLEWFKAYLLGRQGTDSICSREEIELVDRYLRTRIEQPIQQWYGAHFANEIANSLSLLSASAGTVNDFAVEQMEHDIDFAVFNPKAALMRDFTRKVEEFGATIRYPRVDHERTLRLDEEKIRRLEAQKRRAKKATHDIINAIRRSDASAVNALIARGADLRATDEEGRTPMMHAEVKGDERIVKILREASTNKGE